MSEQNIEADKKASVGPEWVLTSEEDFRVALPKMMAYRKLIMQALAAKMGGRNIFSAFLRRKQLHMRADSFFDAMLAMELEVVVRIPQTSKTKKRIEGMRAESLKHRAALAKQMADELAKEAEEAAAVAESSAE